MKLIWMDRAVLRAIATSLTDGHISYDVGEGKGKVADPVQTRPEHISALDCSGFVEYFLIHATRGENAAANGLRWKNSKGQRDWIEKQGFDKESSYAESAYREDGNIRLAYMPPQKKYGHIWLILNGRTWESHKGKGPNRRPWNTPVLLQNVTDCFIIGRRYSITMG